MNYHRPLALPHLHETLRTVASMAALVGLSVICGARAAAADESLLLWPEGAPAALSDRAQDQPEIGVYRPPQSELTGAAVVICPGGGYAVLASDHEGKQVAHWFNSIGVTAFVLSYRHSPDYRHPIPLGDAQRAIRYVRRHAYQFRIDPRRIGVMGFSAGGHLASTAGTHFDAGDPAADDPVERTSCRPDFLILGYPVINLTASYTHSGSRRNLLGDDPDDELVRSLSNETQVTPDTPPTFLFHTAEDPAVDVRHSLDFYEACLKAGVPAELHVYQNGPHGVGLASGDPVASTWPDRLHDWLRSSAMLAAVKRAPVSGEVRVDGEPLRWGMITFLPVRRNAPAAFAMVARGKYKIPAARGAVVGRCRVEIRDLGAVQRRPTIDAVRLLDDGHEYRAIYAGQNEIDFRVEE